MKVSDSLPHSWNRWSALVGFVVYLAANALSRWCVPADPGLSDLVVHAAVTLAALILIVAIWLRTSTVNVPHELGYPGVENRRWPRRILIGIALGVVGFVGLTVVRSVAQSLVGVPSQPSVFAGTFTVENLPLWLGISWLAGGLREELIRVFTIAAFGRAFGRWGLVLGVVVQAVAFGVGHLRQGLIAATVMAFAGLLLGILFVRRRSLVEIFVAHGVYDSVGVILATFVVTS